MSHEATIWAIKQTGKGLSPGAKLVLWHLADRHNPDHGCFPKQTRLAADCEMSRSTINEHLNTLEAKGLIQRIQQIDPKTKQQRPTRYVFGFEADFPAGGEGGSDPMQQQAAMEPKEAFEKPCPESGHGPESVSGNDQKPCPDMPQSRVRLSGHVEPVREPLKEPCVGGDAAHTPDGFEAFWEAHPRQRDRSRCQRLFTEAVKAGASAERIAKAAERYRAENTGNKPMYLAYADNWLDAKRWEDHPDTQPLTARSESVKQAAVFWAGKVKAKAYIPQTAISPEVAACMLSNGLVGEADLLRAGLRL